MKSVGVVRGTSGRLRPGELADAVEGQIAEICRDLAVQVKRMRELQEQADELRVGILEWASAGPTSDETTNRAERH